MSVGAEWNRLDHDERRKALVAVAREQFLVFGYKKTTLDDVANAVGMQKSSLYHYFQNKEKLFVAVVEDLHATMFERLRSELTGDRPVMDDMAAAIDIVRLQAATWKPSVSVLFTELQDVVPVIKEYADSYMDRVNAAFTARLNMAVERGEMRPLPIEELVVVMALFLARAFTARELTCHHEIAAEDPMRYVRAIYAPYITNSPQSDHG